MPGQRPSRQRTVRRVATALVVVLVLTAGVIAADWWVRGQVADRIQQQVEQSLDLASEASTVDVGGFSVLAQLAAGRLDEVTVGVDRFEAGEVAGDLRLVATGVPIDTTQPVDAVHVTFTTDQSSLGAVLPTEDVELADGEIRVGSTLNLLGLQVGITVGLAPSAVDGQLVLTPASVEANGTRTSVEELTARFGAAASAVLQPRTVCVARWLPEDLTLTGARVTTAGLTLTLEASDVILSGLSRLGACPAG